MTSLQRSDMERVLSDDYAYDYRQLDPWDGWSEDLDEIGRHRLARVVERFKLWLQDSNWIVW